MKNSIKFLNFFAGLDKEVLARCSSHEINSYMGITIAVLIPLITGSIAAFLVADYFTNNMVAKVFIVLAWMVVVWMVERIILHSLIPGKMGWLGWSRVALAVFIGIVVSTMMSLILFKDRINMELLDMQTRECIAVEEEYRQREAELSAEVERLQLRYESLQDELNKETQGISGSGHYGSGPAAARLAESMESTLAERNDKKLEIETKLRQLEKVKAVKLDKINEKYQNAGLTTSLETLNRLSRNLNILLPRLVIATLLILLETIPLLSVCGKKNPEYFLIADQMQEANLRLVNACAEHEYDTKTLENNFALNIEERQLRFNDLMEQIHDLEQTYSCLAKGVHNIAQQHVEYLNSSVSESEQEKLKQLYATTLSSINCE